MECRDCEHPLACKWDAGQSSSLVCIRMMCRVGRHEGRTLTHISFVASHSCSLSSCLSMYWLLLCWAMTRMYHAGPKNDCCVPMFATFCDVLPAVCPSCRCCPLLQTHSRASRRRMCATCHRTGCCRCCFRKRAMRHVA